jgi:hypothetical protein
MNITLICIICKKSLEATKGTASEVMSYHIEHKHPDVYDKAHHITMSIESLLDQLHTLTGVFDRTFFKTERIK